ncbi:hypothetical protein, partial [Mycoplasma todarodis]
MNKKTKAGTLGVITLLSLGIIGAGTALVLRTTQEGNNNGIGVASSAKVSAQNIGEIARPDFDSLNKEARKSLQDKINHGLKNFEINKRIDLENKFGDKENVKKVEVLNFVKEFLEGINKETQTKLEAEKAKTADLNKKLSDAKTAEATAKSNSDKATQSLANAKAKTADLNKKLTDAKTAEATAKSNS